MEEHIFRRVKIHMESGHYTFNESWLRECIEYYRKTHPTKPVEGIQSFAIEQWLLSDLREINHENGCLPKNLFEQKIIILNGCYILQMEKMYDISTPKYKQLCKIRNVNVENLKATKETESDFWKPAQKRMFQLHLTDGLQEIQAIEYKPIELLNDTLLPGNKLKLVGPITCRRGIILLEKENIFSVGGEVEDLLIKNSLENVLASFLNLPENPDPYNDVKKATESDMTDLDEEYLHDLEQLVRSQDSKDKEISNSLINSTPSFNRQSGCKINIEKTPIEQNTDKNLSDDELEALINDPDLVNEFPPVKVLQTSTTNVKKIDNFKIPCEPLKVSQKFKTSFENSANKRLYEKSTHSNKNQKFEEKNFCSNNQDSTRSWNFEDHRIHDYSPKNQKFKINKNENPEDLPDSQFFDNYLLFNDEDLIILEDNSSISNNTLPSKSNLLKNQELNDVDFDSGIKKFKNNSQKGKKFDNDLNKNKTLIDESNKSSKSEIYRYVKKPIISNELSTVQSNIIQRPKSLGTNVVLNKNASDQKNNETCTPFKSLFPKYSSKIMEKSNADLEMENLRLISNEKTKSEIDLSSEPKESSKFKNDNLEILYNNLDMRLNKLLNEPSKCDSEKTLMGTKRPASADLVLNTHQSKTLRIVDSKGISEIGEKSETIEKEKYPKNCDFICHLINETLTDKVIFKTVKAQVKSIEKLSNKDGIWKLNGIVSDGTANLKVEFSSQFMEKILGISPLEFSTMKKKAKTDPKLELQLSHNMRSGQQKLEKTDWLMHLELVKNKIPSVVEAFELSMDEKEIFHKRLQILNLQQI